MSSDSSNEMNDIDVQVGRERARAHTHERAREVISTLAELKQRLLYEGDLSEESKDLYNHIEQTLHQAIGELYGWKSEEAEEEADDKISEGHQGGDLREHQNRDDD